MSDITIAWLNAGTLLVASILFFGLYLLSVSPARLARRIGPRAYPLCGTLRAVAMLFEFVAVANYIIYFFYPLSLPLPVRFGWGWIPSIIIAVAIGVPSLWLMVKGMIDAGLEAAVPHPDHTLYGGIYDKMRHPQAAGEVMLWWVIAFAVNSPHLVLISFIWLPIFYWMCVAEERDLVLRYGEPYVAYQRRTGFIWPRFS